MESTDYEEVCWYQEVKMLYSLHFFWHGCYTFRNQYLLLCLGAYILKKKNARKENL